MNATARRWESRTEVSYFVGFDIGQAQEFSAIAIVEKTVPANLPPEHITYAVRHLDRFAPGTTYATMLEALTQVYQTPELKNACLVIDQTGVGKPAVDLFCKTGRAPSYRRVVITAGQHAFHDDAGAWNVPKKDLVSHLQLLLQARRIRVAAELPQSQLLMKELQNFQMKVTLNPTDSVMAWREGIHDDLVLAVAIAVWMAERTSTYTGPMAFIIGGGRPWWLDYRF